MDESLMMLLMRVRDGEISPQEAAVALKKQPFTDLGYAKIDHHRAIRQGAGEVIFGAGKTTEQIAGIVRSMRDAGQERILITRLAKESASALRAEFEGAEIPFAYHELPKTGIVGSNAEPRGLGTIVIATGGTSDIPVAEEAALTAEFLGNHVIRLYDVGVAGLHRTLSHLDELMGASVVVAVAGMEGALASVVGGLVDAPVIAVPTSVGYGASFHGLSALLSMLNSCASGVSVVNIDNGFGAGFLASRINHMEKKG